LKQSLAFLIFLLVAVCGLQARTLTVLLKMIPQQREFIVKEVFADYAKKSGDTVSVADFNDPWELPEKLNSLSVDVVKVPMDIAPLLVEKKLIMPLDSFLASGDLAELDQTYHKMELARVQGKTYFIPRKYETRIMAYLKSKVYDALNGWTAMRPEIEASLKAFCGEGLPQD
jgi:spermidine/putrescine-binding protein